MTNQCAASSSSIRLLYFRGGLLFAWLTLLAVGSASAEDGAGAPIDRPNIIVIFADDMGYGDVGCFGATDIETPHLDRMAREGIRFTDFYVASPVCSASRAALLTGCYANRVGIAGALTDRSRHGIHEDETTIAELLKERGYATGIVGKWHLGHHPQFLPTRNGFDEWLGLPYSNDMWPFHPTLADRFPPLPLFDGERVIDDDVSAEDQRQLTVRYTERAVSFIERHADGPFFLYFAHSMPHVPLFVSDAFAGKSRRGLYGDVIMEIDWSVGRILETLARLKLDERTLVLFTSDNGPWLAYGNHAGSAAPLREGKMTVWDGGVRVPFIARWPEKIPAGATCREPAMTIDLLPTFAGLAGGKLPPLTIDGRDISPLLLGEKDAVSPHDALYFYWENQLQAVRAGKWKLHFPHPYRALRTPGRDGRPGAYEAARTDLALYDMERDPDERNNVASEHPDVVERIKRLAERARIELGDAATGQRGTGLRAAGQLADQD